MSFLSDKPGLLFVWATLLPLAAFTLLLILGGLRNFLRPYREQPAWAGLYRFLDHDVTSRGSFYVGFAGIVLAFLCSFSGFCLYLGEHHAFEAKTEPLKAEIKQFEAKAHENKAEAHQIEVDEIQPREEKVDEARKDLEVRWADQMTWAAVHPVSLRDPEQGTRLSLGYRIDTLSALMFTMVTFVASLIFLFSSGYMAEELHARVEDHEVHTDEGHFARRGRFGRFFLYLSLFSFSMLNLLLADNLFQIFVSWELVGVCSYLLIGFYYERQSASNAANKAFITNRVGDAGFIIGLLILWTYVGTFNFQEIFERLRVHGESVNHATNHRYDGRFITGEWDEEKQSFVTAPPGESASHVLILPRNPPGHFHLRKTQVHGQPAFATPAFSEPRPAQFGAMPYWMLVVAGLGIFLGCVGKSAQFPLHVWLPDAMEGPTPVSALIHAATMVAAGVYLVGRTYPLFTYEVLLTISYVGGITLFVAASIAVVMTDIKKVLAYSTVSQLGYMMLGLGVGGWAAGLFHLVTHAFFKALLFLGSGSVIYGCHHQQDMMKMGGLYPKMRITALTMLMGVFAIAGFPMFSGWYSKDAVLASALGFALANKQHFLLFILPLVTAGITTFYMFRMWFMTFTGTPRDHHVYDHAHESPWMMTTPLLILGVLSVCVAWGWPTWDPEASAMEHVIQASRPGSVESDFGSLAHGESHGAAQADHGHDHGEAAHSGAANNLHVNHYMHQNHALAGNLALIMVILGCTFALGTYFYNVLDPAESKAQFPGLHRFLAHKWYFDELYSALLVRPAMILSRWCTAFDRYLVDGLVNLMGRINLRASFATGRFDRTIVDGLVNLVGDVWFATGNWLRTVQTGYLRSYVLFLVLAAMGLWVLLSAFVGTVVRGAP